MAASIDFHAVGGEAAWGHADELGELYAEVYAEPPYCWGSEHAALFKQRFEGQCRQNGFALMEAREGEQLIGIAFGVTLRPTTPWWQGLLSPLPATTTTEYPNRTFAFVELLVRAPWRRRHVGQTLHDRLLANRSEERATLTVLPAAAAAQAAYRKWGWERVRQKRNPLPGSPVFDVLVKPLRRSEGAATHG